MPVKYIGNALYKESNGKLVWEPQVLIPVSSISKIPKGEFALPMGSVTANAEINPVKGNVSIKGARLPFSQQQEITSFPWETMQLLDNQIDYYFKLQNDEEVHAKMEDFEKARNGSYQMQNVEAIEFLRQNRKNFRIRSLYLGCSQSLLDYAKSALKKFSYQAEKGNIENVGRTDPLSPWNVWYVVGSFDESLAEKEKARQSAIQNARDNAAIANTEVAKPSMISITREKEDFTKAKIIGENVSLTDQYRYEENIVPKIKFIFDNGTEAYAEIIDIEIESEFSMQSQITTETIASLGPSQEASTLLDLSGVISSTEETQDKNMTVQVQIPGLTNSSNDTPSSENPRQDFFPKQVQSAEFNTNKETSDVKKASKKTPTAASLKKFVQ